MLPDTRGSLTNEPRMRIAGDLTEFHLGILQKGNTASGEFFIEGYGGEFDPSVKLFFWSELTFEPFQFSYVNNGMLPMKIAMTVRANDFLTQPIPRRFSKDVRINNRFIERTFAIPIRLWVYEQALKFTVSFVVVVEEPYEAGRVETIWQNTWVSYIIYGGLIFAIAIIVYILLTS